MSAAGAVESADPGGLDLDAVERWCAALRAAGAAGDCPVMGEAGPASERDGVPGWLTRLSAWPRVSRGGPR